VTQDPNRDNLERVVEALGDIIDELMLVGGSAIGPLITDPARPPVRSTLDVDLVAEVAALTDYYSLSARLRRRGFVEGELVCRWHKEDLIVDVLPTDGAVLGFSNRWYASAVAHAQTTRLASGRHIRIIDPVHLIATKIEAFHQRGGGDYLHHDIEDLVTLIDGRPTIADEVLAAPDTVRRHLQAELGSLLANPDFVDRMSGHLGSTEHRGRKDIVLARMRKIVGG
jgi:predicted nucleotidyltransferase